MANLNYHSSKEAIKAREDKRKTYYTNKGMIECPKHIDEYYDPKKFNQCFKCFEESKHI